MVNAATLPQDVLITLFEHIASASWAPPGDKELLRMSNVPTPFPWVDVPTLTSSLRVCKHWRESILATGLCWSTIVVDFDELEHDGSTRVTSRINLHLKRTRNTPLTLILKNDRREVCIEGILPSLTHLLEQCTMNATRVYARLLTPTLFSLLVGMLSEVPKLEVLALWHIRSFEVEKALGIHVDIGWAEDYLPDTYLKSAPQLRTIYTRGVPYLDPSNGLLALPRIERLVVDDTASMNLSLLDFTLFLLTFANVTSLALLLDASRGITVSMYPVIFPALEYLEMGGGATDVFFQFSLQISTPKLQDLCLHLQYLKRENEAVFLLMTGAALRSSPAPSKRLILKGFASKFPYASHIRCLDIMDTFDFVESVEFFGGVFRFPVTWASVWRPGGLCGWKALLDQEYFDDIQSTEISLYGGSEADDTQQTLSSGLERCQPPSPSLHHADEYRMQVPLPHNVIISLDAHTIIGTPSVPKSPAMNSRPFMPQLRSIVFRDCVFPDHDGATRFAAALAGRQNDLKERTGGSRALQRVELINVTGSGSSAFIEELRRSNGSDTTEIRSRGTRFS